MKVHVSIGDGSFLIPISPENESSKINSLIEDGVRRYKDAIDRVVDVDVSKCLLFNENGDQLHSKDKISDLISDGDKLVIKLRSADVSNGRVLIEYGRESLWVHVSLSEHERCTAYDLTLVAAKHWNLNKSDVELHLVNGDLLAPHVKMSDEIAASWMVSPSSHISHQNSTSPTPVHTQAATHTNADLVLRLAHRSTRTNSMDVTPSKRDTLVRDIAAQPRVDIANLTDDRPPITSNVNVSSTSAPSTTVIESQNQKHGTAAGESTHLRVSTGRNVDSKVDPGTGTDFQPPDRIRTPTHVLDPLNPLNPLNPVAPSATVSSSSLSVGVSTVNANATGMGVGSGRPISGSGSAFTSATAPHMAVGRTVQRMRRGSIALASSSPGPAPGNGVNVNVSGNGGDDVDTTQPRPATENVVAGLMASAVSGFGALNYGQGVGDDSKNGRYRVDPWSSFKSEWNGFGVSVSDILLRHVSVFIAQKWLHCSARECRNGLSSKGKSKGEGESELITGRMNAAILCFDLHGIDTMIHRVLEKYEGVDSWRSDSSCQSRIAWSSQVLSKALDRVYGPLCDCVHKNGGDILALSHNRIIAAWQPRGINVVASLTPGGKLTLAAPGVLTDVSHSHSASHSNPNSNLNPSVSVSVQPSTGTSGIKPNSDSHNRSDSTMIGLSMPHPSPLRRSPIPSAGRVRSSSISLGQPVVRPHSSSLSLPYSNAAGGGGGVSGRGIDARVQTHTPHTPHQVNSGSNGQAQGLWSGGGKEVPHGNGHGMDVDVDVRKNMSATDAVRLATQCASDMVKLSHSSPIIRLLGISLPQGENSENETIQCRAGVGVGVIQAKQAGGSEDIDCHLVMSGDGYDSAVRVCGSTLGWGTVSLSDMAWKSIADFCHGEQGQGSDSIILTELKEPLLIVEPDDRVDPTSVYIKSQKHADTLTATSADAPLACQWHFPRQILAHMFTTASDTSFLAGERVLELGIQPDLDAVADMVILSVKLSSRCSRSSSFVHSATLVCQQASLLNGGSVFRIEREGEGDNIVIYIGFGFPPVLMPLPILIRQAVKAGWHALAVIDQMDVDGGDNGGSDVPNCGAGVAVNWTFCSSVGSSTRRREYVVIGRAVSESVQLAGRALADGQLLCCDRVVKYCDMDSRHPFIRFATIDSIGDVSSSDMDMDNDSGICHDHEAFVDIDLSHIDGTADIPSKAHRFEPPWHEGGVIGHARARAEIWHRVRSFAREPSAFSGVILLEGASGSGRSALISEVLSGVVTDSTRNRNGGANGLATHFLSLDVVHAVAEPSTKLTPYHAIHVILSQLLNINAECTAEDLAEVRQKIFRWLTVTGFSNGRGEGDGTETETDSLLRLYPLLNVVLPPGIGMFTSDDVAAAGQIHEDEDDQDQGQDASVTENVNVNVTKLPKHSVCGDMNGRVRSDARLELVLSLIRAAAFEYAHNDHVEYSVNGSVNGNGKRSPSHSPLVICVEELQWIDSASYSILCELASEVNDPAPLLMIFSSADLPPTPTVMGGGGRDRGSLHEEWPHWRPHFLSMIRDGPYTLPLHLSELRMDEMVALVARTSRVHDVEASLWDKIMKASEGLAVKVELITRWLIHSERAKIVKNNRKRKKKTGSSSIGSDSNTNSKRFILSLVPTKKLKGSIPLILEDLLSDIIIRQYSTWRRSILCASALLGSSFDINAVAVLLGCQSSLDTENDRKTNPKDGGSSVGDGDGKGMGRTLTFDLDSISSSADIWKLRAELIALVDDGLLAVPTSEWRSRGNLMSFAESAGCKLKSRNQYGNGQPRQFKRNARLKGLMGGVGESESDIPGTIGEDEGENGMTEAIPDSSSTILIPGTFFFPAEVIRHAIIKRFVKKQSAAEWHEAAATYYERVIKKFLVNKARGKLGQAQGVQGEGEGEGEGDEQLSRIFSTRSKSIFRAPAFLRRTLTSKNMSNSDRHKAKGVNAGAGLPSLDKDYIEQLSPVLAAVSRHWTLALGLGHFRASASASTATGSGSPSTNMVLSEGSHNQSQSTSQAKTQVHTFVPAGGCVGSTGVHRVAELVHALNLLAVGGQRSIALRCPAEALSSFLAGKRLCMVYVEGKAVLPSDPSYEFSITSQHLRVLAARFSRMAGEACVAIARLARELHASHTQVNPHNQSKSRVNASDDACSHFNFALELLNRQIPKSIIARKTAYWRVTSGQRLVNSLPNFCHPQRSVILAEVEPTHEHESAGHADSSATATATATHGAQSQVVSISRHDSQSQNQYQSHSHSQIPSQSHNRSHIQGDPVAVGTWDDSSAIAHEELRCLVDLGNWYRYCGDHDNALYVTARALGKALPRWRAGESKEALADFVEVCTEVLDVATQRHAMRSMKTYHDLLMSATGLFDFELSRTDHRCTMPVPLGGEGEGRLAGQLHAEAAVVLGRSSALQGRFDEAIQLLSASCRYFEHVFNREKLSKSAIALCHVYFVLGRFEVAKEAAMLALDSADALQDDLRRLQALVMLAQCCLETDDEASAAQALMDAQTIAEVWQLDESSAHADRDDVGNNNGSRHAHLGLPISISGSSSHGHGSGSGPSGSTLNQNVHAHTQPSASGSGLRSKSLYTKRKQQVVTHFGLVVALAYLRTGNKRQEAYDVMGLPCEQLAAERPMDLESVSSYAAACEILLTLLEGEHLLSLHHAGEFVSPKMGILGILVKRMLDSVQKFTVILPCMKPRLLLYESMRDSSTGNEHAAEEALTKALKLANASDHSNMPFERALIIYYVTRRGGVADERESKLNEVFDVFNSLGAVHYASMTNQQIHSLRHMEGV